MLCLGTKERGVGIVVSLKVRSSIGGLWGKREGKKRRKKRPFCTHMLWLLILLYVPFWISHTILLHGAKIFLIHILFCDPMTMRVKLNCSGKVRNISGFSAKCTRIPHRNFQQSSRRYQVNWSHIFSAKTMCLMVYWKRTSAKCVSTTKFINYPMNHVAKLGRLQIFCKLSFSMRMHPQSTSSYYIPYLDTSLYLFLPIIYIFISPRCREGERGKKDILGHLTSAN